MLTFENIAPFAMAPGKYLHYDPFCVLGGDGNDLELAEIIHKMPYLQIILKRFEQFPSHFELMPIKQGADMRVQLGVLNRFFDEVEQLGNEQLLFSRPRPSVMGAWSAIAEKRELDPYLIHFSLSHADKLVPLCEDLRVYALHAEGAAARLADFENSIWVKTILSEYILKSNVPGIDVTGWTLAELCADPLVQNLAALTKEMYYFEFCKGSKPFAQSLCCRV